MNRPLPQGSVITYCDMIGIVVKDEGGDTIKVDCDGSIQNWLWNFENVECKVVSIPSE